MLFRKRGFRAMVLGLLVATGLALTPAAFARSHVSFGISVPGVAVGYGPGYYGAYYAPAYAPAYYGPAYYDPYYYDSYYYGPSVVYYGGYGGHRHHRYYRDYGHHDHYRHDGYYRH